MSSTDDETAIGESFVWRGWTFVIADAQHDKSEMGEHWHLTVVPQGDGASVRLGRQLRRDAVTGRVGTGADRSTQQRDIGPKSAP